MSTASSAVNRDAMRRWLANWRAVNEAQDELVRAAPAPNPVACLEQGLEMIDLARQVTSAGQQAVPTDANKDDAAAIQRTWARLRSAYRR